MTGGAETGFATAAVLVAAILSVVGYPAAVAAGRGGRWPRHRTVSWVAGTLVVVTAVTGPLGAAAHHGFVAHMVAHLLLGMAAPLLLVVAAPVTVVLRALPVGSARVLAKVLRSMPIRLLTEPVIAAVLDIGGLWLLYTTGLYQAMHLHPAVHVLVHVHMFLTGYLFTAALVGVDPAPHRRGHGHRAAVLVSALAAHDILAKHLYAHPPAGVAAAQAEPGAMIMYYGGDAVDVVLIIMLCAGWYGSRAARIGRSGPRSVVALQHQHGAGGHPDPVSGVDGAVPSTGE